MESIPFWCDINSNGNITIKGRSQWPLSCEIVGSNPAWGMDVCLLWVLYIVRCTHVTACWKRIKNDGPYRNTYLVRYTRYYCIKVGQLILQTLQAIYYLKCSGYHLYHTLSHLNTSYFFTHQIYELHTDVVCVFLHKNRFSIQMYVSLSLQYVPVL